MIPLEAGDRVFVMPDPAPDLAWIGAVQSVSGDRAIIEIPPAPEGVPSLSPGTVTQLAVRRGEGILLVAVEVVSVTARLAEVRALAQGGTTLGQAPRPVSRRHLRTPIQTACELQLAGEEPRVAWIADLGAGGAEIVVPGLLSAPESGAGKVRFELPGEGRWEIDVRIVRSIVEHDDTRLGVSFDGLDAAIEARIDGFVHFVRRTRLTRRPL